MGSGCSSPLKRLGGKRGKSTRRNSSSAFGADQSPDANMSNDNQKPCRQQPSASSHKHASHEPSEDDRQHRFILENENTIQSEINDDHPSTASYYTDGRNHIEEVTKNSEHSASLEPKSSAGNVTTTPSSDPNNHSLSGGSVVAKIMGINGGSYVPHDRHLLVSPALSPAPSTCYSPSPANSTSNCNYNMLDLNDLNEACKILTFGLPINHQIPTNLQFGQHTHHKQSSQRISHRANLSELHNHYTQQLVQTQNELNKLISVVFITSDSFQSPSSRDENTNESSNLNLQSLANNIESNMKTFCDEYLFNLRFVNLSHSHLSNNFQINNLLSAAIKIFEQEYHENSQRIIVIVLTNLTSGANTSTDSINPSTNISQQNLDKRQMPTIIDAQTMNFLQQSTATYKDNSTEGIDISSLLKRWYNQVGSVYHLNPIYLVDQKILANSKDERDLAWQNWLKESNELIKFIDKVRTNNESYPELKSIYASLIDYIINEPTILKRTLLIRNYSQLANSTASYTQQQQSTGLIQNKDVNQNDLVRLLADPNKLNIKRSMGQEEFNRTVTDWISDNFSKIVEGILENQIINGKQVPPFIEKNLFIELSLQRHRLEHYLDNITESFESKCQNFFKVHIAPIINNVISNSNSTTVSNIADQSSGQSHSSNHLVFVSGPKGCGKSSLFSQIIKLAAQEISGKAQLIYRFCGISMDSMSPNRLLRSICEQFCQTQGENITAASYIYSAKKDIMNSLNKIIKQQISIIFIDGLNIFYESDNKRFSETDLDWLYEIESNPRIKFFITLETDSELYKQALGTYTEATYITLDYPSIAEWAQMLTSTARSKRFNSATSLYDEIKNLNIDANQAKDQSETKLNFKDFSDIIHMCQIRKLNNELVYPELSFKMMQNNAIENLKNMHHVILIHLHYLIPPQILYALFLIIRSSRYGLSERDIINIMSTISQPKTSIHEDGVRFSTALLNYIKIHLHPWLLYVPYNGTVKMTFQRDFLKNSIEFYTSNMFKNASDEYKEILIEYFSRQTRSKQSASSMTSHKSDLAEQIERPADLLSYGIHISELIHLLTSTNPQKAREHILGKQQFFAQFLYNSMPEEFIEDYQILKDAQPKKSSGNLDELNYLVNYIRQSVYPLRYDGSQIYSQIYCRAIETTKSGKNTKSKKLNEIITMASCPPRKSLLPISETSVNSFIKTRIGLNPLSSCSTATSPSSLVAPNQPTSNSSVQKGLPQQLIPGKQKIYTIKDNHRHVIVIYPDRGTLSVWDIFEEKSVRTINNLDQPRDLRMIDQKRAVILCNRELRVYDLDSGLLLNKLKGVMNQKMPFFEIFGDNYVVALARNRMYVNMLNLNTGELETTFKVGEDRFLNSLLVSANGGICVCGDETQKPFPLLVWNLNERRLLYDLRLEKHEFLTRMSAISDDGHFVISVCRQLGDADSSSTSGASRGKSSTNFIVIYDLNSGTLFKKWKPGVDSCGVAISLSANRSGKVVNCIVNNTILVWDLATGSKKHTLSGHTAPVDTIKVQNNRLFSMDSTCRDQSLRIWDIEEGYCIAVFSPDAPINCCQISIRGDALICGFAAESRLSTLVICKNETVNDVVKRNKRRKSSKSLYIFDDPPARKASS